MERRAGGKERSSCGTNEGNSLQIGLEAQRVIFYFVAVVKCTEIAKSPETVPVIIRT